MQILMPWAGLAARILMSVIFVLSGLSKLGNPEANGAFLKAQGLSEVFVYPVGLFELLGGIAIIIGWQTRYVALALAGFCLLTGIMVHLHPEDQFQMIMFMKNLAMAGGFLLLFQHGAGAFSLDARKA